MLKIYLILINFVLISSREDSERATRAAFIQRLLNKQKHLEGRIKLLGGSNRYEGNVYIYHAGRWGTVCDDSWDDAAAQVVCRVFNKTGVATRASQFGGALDLSPHLIASTGDRSAGSFFAQRIGIVIQQGNAASILATIPRGQDLYCNERYWMDDVVCEGDEKALTQCIFSGWGSSDCEVSEVAGVVCTKDLEESPADNIRKKPTVYLHEAVDVRGTSLRLVGGRNSYEGRIEIYHKGTWGSICPDGWTLFEASAVCHHLALGHAEQALQTDYFGSSKIVLSGVQCEGNETNIFMCKYRDFGDVKCPGETGHAAGVVCTERLADLLLDTTAIERTAHLQDVPMFQLTCAMEENCLSKSAYKVQQTNPNWQFETRRLLRFTASSLNIGNADFRPYLPKHLWQWHLCHMHYHSMEVFATFDVLDASGRRIAEGHKASFCLEDNTCLSGVEKQYSCKNYGDQGVSVNCSDIYQYNIDCQWVDVTDVATGDYTFKVAVNPHARVAEQSYHNNAASCMLRLTESYAQVYGCKLNRP